MEKHRNSSRNFKDVDEDPAMRLQGPPPARKGRNMFGSDSMSSATEFYRSSKKRTAPQDICVDIDDDHDSDLSDDPLNSLSEASPKKAKKHSEVARYKKALSSQPSEHNKRSEALKGLKFKKNKSGDAPEQSKATKRTPVDKKTHPSQSKPSAVEKDIFSSPPSSPPPRPRPRPTTKVRQAPPKPPAPAPFPLERDPSPSRHTSIEACDSAKPLQPQPFPVLSPPRTSSVTPSDHSDEQKSLKAQKFPMDLGSNAHTAKKPKPFPMVADSGSAPEPSRPGRKDKGTSSTKVLPPSHSRDPRKAKAGKAKRKVIHSEDEDESDACGSPQAKVAPFPLSTEFMQVDVAQARKKRHSSSSSSEESSPRKKTRPGDTSLIDPDGPMEESFFETVDPSTLCPYCDNPLPPTPSPTLSAMLDAMAKKSYPDPRPTNIRGRKAPFSTFISLCQRHRFESEILPEARSKGWPSTIDWNLITKRIEKMKPKLQSLLDDSSENGPRAQSAAWSEIMRLVKEKGSRAATGVKDQFLNFEKTQPGYYGELGSLIIHQTLYDLFPPSSIDVESIFPLGAEEFLQRVLIPEVALRLIMEDQRLRGASGRQQALQILRDSSAYGVAMFPAEQTTEGKKGVTNSGNPGSSKASGLSGNRKQGLTAGETIIMERARKRRKEIEEEEAREEEEERAKKAELEGVGRPKPRPKPIARGSSKSSLMDLDVNVPSLKSDTESGRDDMRYDTESADDWDVPDRSRQKGKGKYTTSRPSSRTSDRRSNPPTSHSPTLNDSVGTGEGPGSNLKGKKKARGLKESVVIDIADDEDEGVATKTPKAKPFPIQLDHDSTPRPGRSQSNGPQHASNIPLVRARMARAKDRAVAQNETPAQSGGGSWKRSLRQDDRFSGDTDSGMESADSYQARREDRKLKKTKPGSLKAKKNGGDDPGTWLLSSPSSSQTSITKDDPPRSQPSRRKR